jgi:hypothetical protein
MCYGSYEIQIFKPKKKIISNSNQGKLPETKLMDEVFDESARIYDSRELPVSPQSLCLAQLLKTLAR